MLTLYRPGTGPLHRMPAGPKLLLVVVAVLAVSLLPSTWIAAAVAATLPVLAYALAGLGDGMLGMRELGRQVYAVRWVIVITLAGQLLFLGPEAAVANTARVTSAVVLAALLVLTTRVADLLDAIERGLRPLAALRIDPARAALLLTVTLSTLPVLARLARDVRDAQRARGARAGVRAFAVPFLVVAFKHADELGDALTARGVR
ncbi:energy-coupling factor transporter transmembrane component T family protein [Leifsonia shinshuensis]|uniref:Energy-coupling factor transporter transmembrane protein EcfT n=1 Tax=Leifsonia shinshuensis TaxID=150026 RepID=A0A7G6YEU4_9MICO|nr:energy-coupling factor transporter transmembrane protein EcfT [Leifsonia shinshuensis]QNE37009.1 energy-coupling factor transporter transmembrane protein EcfT [Leifsonia shinshuensis]